MKLYLKLNCAFLKGLNSRRQYGSSTEKLGFSHYIEHNFGNMRNLSLLTSVNVAIPKSGNCIVHFAVDSDSGRVYFNTETDVVGLDPTIHEETFSVGLEELANHAIEVTGIQFLQGEESLCISTKQGDLLLVNVLTKMVEYVGSVESGFEEMRWSPDQELLLLATGNNTLISMTREFEPLAEVSIHAKEFGKGEFINVGWGKKETQFHGSEGKGAAVKKDDSIEPALPWDDKRTRISWRGDGQYFAVHRIDPENGNRKFRVWDRECILQYTSEYVSGLESAFAWRPSGNLIASSQRKPHRHDIVFFEKNGLQHGEFTLPFDKDQMKVKHLEWNSDSSILMVWATPLVQEENFNQNLQSADCVQLWTMSNYHWYLKQSLQFPDGKTPVCVQWDAESSHKLHIICKNGLYKQFVFNKNICHSNPPSICGDKDSGETSMAFVAVIDGKNVLMTPFKVMVVPPPMSSYKLQLPCEANAVAFSSVNSTCNDVAIILKSNEVAVFTTNNPAATSKFDESKLTVKLDGAGGIGFKSRVNPHVPTALLKIEVECQDSIDISALHHWIWLNSTQMFAVSPGTLPCTDIAVIFEFNQTASTLTAKNSCTINGIILSAHVFSSDFISLQVEDGNLMKCHIPSLVLSEYTLPSGDSLKLPRPCPHAASCTFMESQCIVGLSEHSRMYINDTEIASDCSSFCIHDDFLFLTTHAHQLKCISRNVPLPDILKYFNTPLEGRSLLQNCAVIETHRALERGSKIVTVTPSDSRLILQMPRGNLELIHPRCLVLSLVSRLIKTLEYGKAFTIMKKHRINMNLLYDVDKQVFESIVSRFVSELGLTANINIFLSDLQNEDLTKSMYQQYFFFNINKNSTETASDKVNAICALLINEMEIKMKSEQRFVMSIVTAHVKKQPSEVGLALKRIKELADAIGHEEKLVGDTLKYMTVLVDSNTLFNEALGTYDFKLVLMVAEKSQLDPKEFLPMLRELQQFKEDFRKYKIDLKLRRYSSALDHISKCEDHFDECLELITKHGLYRQALKLFVEGSERYNDICKSYGEYLSSKHKYEEAGIMFSRCQELEKALESFTNSHNYSLTLRTAYKLKMGEGEIVELAYKVAEKAKSRGHYTDAVDVLEYHARDIEVALETALEAHFWSKALRIAEQYGRTDLIETNVIPSIKEAYEQVCQSLESHRELIIKHSTRLQTVRQMKEQQRMQAILEGVEGIGLDSDLYSDTSSTMAGSVTSKASSTASRSTGRTAKSRKKKERRAYSLKEGSKFEDLALLHSLKVTITAVDSLSGDIGTLISHLSVLHHDNLAEQMQVLYQDVRAVVSRVLPTIWSASAFQNGQLVTGPQSTANSIIASMQSRQNSTEEHRSGEDRNSLVDLDLFVPPKPDQRTWIMDLYPH